MKRKSIFSLLFAGGLTALLVTGSFLNVNTKRVHRVGDIIDGNKEVIKTGVDTSKLIKYKPLVVPTDTYYSKQKNYSMSNVGNIESTWDYYKGAGTKIAIIDSGITYGHEDFPNLSNRSAFFETNTSTGDVTKTMATSDNWECMKHEYDTDYNEWDSHGSNVAGSAAAAMNAVGTVGIAPEAEILMLKIDFWDESVNAAIDYAVAEGADVINMSLGWFDDDDYPAGRTDHSPGTKTVNAAPINRAINAGVIVVAAAGNETTSCYSYPACNDGVIGVGALSKNSSTSAASFSNFNKSTDTQSGNHNVDVMAPGTVWAPGLDASEISNPKNKYPKLGYQETQGTSFSSPIVAGAAALWKQKYNGTPAQFEADLYSRSVDMGNFQKYGNGRLDVYKLLDIENEGINVSPHSLSLNTRSESQTITATALNSTIKSWTSSNTSVVTVSGATGSKTCNATVSVVGAGSATITVTANDGATATINVQVDQYVSVTGITTVPVSGSEVGQGRTLDLQAAVTPTNATNKEITFSSSDTSVATVSNKGVITGGDIGQATITMSAADNITKTFVVNVVECHTQEYTIVFKDNGTETDGSAEKTSYSDLISSSEISISSVSSASKVYQAKSNYGIKFSSSSSNGNMTMSLSSAQPISQIVANAAQYGTDSSSLSINSSSSKSISGTSFTDYTFDFDGSEKTSIEINATKRVYLKSLTVVVDTSTDPTIHVTGVSLNKSSMTLDVGDTSQLTATVSPNNATNQSITWSVSCSPTGCINVDDDGLVRANAAGSGTVTVTTVDGGKTASCNVTVMGEDPTGDSFTIDFSEGGNCTSTSGSFTGVSFTTAQSSGSNPPVYNSNSHELRMYVNSTNGNGNTFTLTPDNNYTITGLSITASSTDYTPTVKYNLDGGSDITGSWSSTTMNISGLNVTSSLVFRNAQTGSNTQLRIKSVKVYLSSSSSPEDPTLTGISLNTDNVQKTFNVNDSFNYTGLVVTATYSSGPSKTVTPTSVSSPDMTTIGQKTITVSYTESEVTKTATYTITVSEVQQPVLTSISVSGQTTTYNVGDTFSFDGTVTATYSSGPSKTVTPTSVSSPDMSSTGTKTVTVTYTENEVTKTVTYDITVKESSTPSYDDPQTVTYEITSKTAAELTDGTAPENSSISFNNNGTNGDDQMTSGKRELWTLANYDGCLITKIELNLHRNSRSGAGDISATNNGSAVSLDVDSVSGSNIGSSYEFLAVYSNSEGFKCNGDIVITIEGTQNSIYCDSIKVTYRSEVQEDKVIDHLDVSYSGGNVFVNGQLDTSKVKVDATFTLSDKYPQKTLSSSEYELSGFSSATAGTKTVTVTYTGSIKTKTTPLTTSFNVEVINDNITSIDVSVDKSVFHPGETISKSNLTVTLTWLSGKTETTTDYTFTSRQFTYEDAPSGGSSKNIQLSINYGGETHSFSVAVSRNAYNKPSDTSLTLTGAQGKSAGITGTTASGRKDYASLNINGVTCAATNIYVYNSTYFSFGLDAGEIHNIVKLSQALSNVDITNRSGARTDQIIYVSVDGKPDTYVEKSKADFTNNNYYFFKIEFVESSSSFSNFSSIDLSLKGVESASNVANYIMYEDTKNQCETKFDIACLYFENMSAAERNTFMTSNDFVIATARERLNAWAAYLGKQIIFENNDYVIKDAKSFNSIINMTESDNLAIVAIASILSAASIAGILIIKRRKVTK